MYVCEKIYPKPDPRVCACVLSVRALELVCLSACSSTSGELSGWLARRSRLTKPSHKSHCPTSASFLSCQPLNSLGCLVCKSTTTTTTTTHLFSTFETEFPIPEKLPPVPLSGVRPDDNHHGVEILSNVSISVANIFLTRLMTDAHVPSSRAENLNSSSVACALCNSSKKFAQPSYHHHHHHPVSPRQPAKL